MLEYSTALRATADDSSNLTDQLLQRVSASPEKTLFLHRDGLGDYLSLTSTAFLERVRQLAKGLIALGITPGSTVSVMASTRVEWTLIDEAILFAGAVCAPIYETSSPSQAAWILSDAQVRAVVVDHAQRASVISAACRMNEAQLPVFTMDEGGLDQLALLGESISDEQLESARTSRTLDDVATLVYTSGTMGRPKGCEITHRNFAVIGLNAVEHLPEFLSQENASTIMFLPLAHVLARCVQFVCIERGITLLHSASPADLIEDMAYLKPTFLLAVPRIFEKIHAQAKAQVAGTSREKIFAQAERTAIAYSRALGSGAKPALALRAQHALFDRLVYSKIRELFGGRISYCVSGGSPLASQLAHFFIGAEVIVLEGYGLTESTAPLTCNQPNALKVGTVGKPLPGTALRVAEDGEVLARGVGLFAGYRNNPEATAAAFTQDGWFRTGDVGTLDEEGFLTITGRKKEIIVTAGGKNVAPAPLEERIREHALVDQCVVVGEGRPFVAAIISLDEQALKAWSARELGEELSLGHAAGDERVRSELQKQVDYANELVSRAESIRAFHLTDEVFDEASGRMTASLKLRRTVIMDEFSEQIERLYARG